MADYELRFPVGGPYTASWLPSKPGSISGSGLEMNTGEIRQVMADKRTMMGDKLVDPFNRYIRAFSGLAAGELDALATFTALVGNQKFEFRDGPCGPVTDFRTVRFSVDQVKRTAQPAPGGTWSVTVAVQDA